MVDRRETIVNRLPRRNLGLLLCLGPLGFATGCAPAAPTPVAATTSPGSPPAKTTAVEEPAAETIVDLTPRCAARFKELMALDKNGKFVHIYVIAEENCTGFLYQMGISEESPPATTVTRIQGIPLAVDTDDVAFLRGSTLDFLPDPGGFKFDNPSEDPSLLWEYKAKKAEEERLRPIEEAESKQVDTKQAVADLLTDNRQQAFEDLRLWWKFNQPEVWSKYESTVGRVDRYELPGGEPITVVFTGEEGKQRGGIYLINPDGRQTVIFQGHNFIGETDQFIDITNDGLPEIVALNQMGGKAEDNSNRVVTDAESLIILPVTARQTPLLRVLFDVRPFNAHSTWRWRLQKNASGAQDVVIEQQVGQDYEERARYVWNSEQKTFEGPAGSKQEGFIANPGNLDEEVIKTFLKLKLEAATPPSP
jgi:Fe-S cluster assembly iron-binding protein IscA